ncbi:MAG: hypothetical protein QOG53_3281 [Frankiales bacterium]|nr:hypothetical protein [Frankiales bacterium]
MRHAPTCPRCGGSVREPGLWSSSWRCERHGDVHPLHAATRPSVDAVEHVVRQAKVPVWIPWPLPTGWVVTGAAHAGDERSGGVATVVACSGPSPLGGAGELLLIAEAPGVGLGARYAGLPGPDPGDGVGSGPPHAKVEAAGHPTPMWALDVPDAAVYVGEAKGNWLWAILWPSTAGVLLLENVILQDLRTQSVLPDLPFGALSPRLNERHAA